MPSQSRRTAPEGVAALRAFGRSVRGQRRKLGLSVRALASRAGISPAYVASIELGKNPSTGKPPVPSIQVVRRLADALELDVAWLIEELGGPVDTVDDDHVLLYCLERPARGVLDAVERTFGSRVDHWLYIADPREPIVDDVAGRATVVRWDLGSFPYGSRQLEPEAVLAALDEAIGSLTDGDAQRRVGIASADSSAVMRRIQDPASEVALERVWHRRVNDACVEHLGAPAAIDVCVYDDEDIQALGLTIDQLATALSLVQDHHQVFVWDEGEAIGGPFAIQRILERAQPAGVSTGAWSTLTDAAAQTLAGHRASAAATVQ